jgi:hypothetical protein
MNGERGVRGGVMPRQKRDPLWGNAGKKKVKWGFYSGETNKTILAKIKIFQKVTWGQE